MGFGKLLYLHSEAMVKAFATGSFKKVGGLAAYLNGLSWLICRGDNPKCTTNRLVYQTLQKLTPLFPRFMDFRMLHIYIYMHTVMK